MSDTCPKSPETKPEILARRAAREQGRRVQSEKIKESLLRLKQEAKPNRGKQAPQTGDH
jgi:hypothetical protein